MLTPGGLIGVRVKKNADDTRNGVDIQDVFAGSPAAAAGLKRTIDCSPWTAVGPIASSIAMRPRPESGLERKSGLLSCATAKK